MIKQDKKILEDESYVRCILRDKYWNQDKRELENESQDDTDL